jgi:hypothetical protein
MYSSTLKVVNDPDLDREFGAELAESIRASVHAGGDCRVCGVEIKDADRVRIDTQQSVTPTTRIYYVRHASCEPSTQGFGAHILTAHTYTLRFYGTKMYQRKDPTWIDRLLRRDPGETEIPIVVAIVHPGVDGMLVRQTNGQTWPDSLASMFEENGFGQLGVLNMSHHQSPDDPFTAERNHGQIMLHGQNNFIGTEYAETVPAGPMQEHLDKAAGVLLGFATTTDINQIPPRKDIVHTPEARDELRYAWLPFADREDSSSSEQGTR